MATAKIKNDDLGMYIKSRNVGLMSYIVPSGLITGSIGKLQWGKSQFGQTGILGFPASQTGNHQIKNVQQV